jgi:hypothetical protein
MSYSCYDLFDEHILPKLSACTDLDDFISLISKAINNDARGSDYFKDKLLNICINDDNAELHNKIKIIFGLINQYKDNIRLRSLEYQEGFDVIHVKYDDEIDTII